MRFLVVAGQLLGIIAFCAAPVCGVLYLMMFTIGLTGHCDYEDLGTIRDVAGADFEIREASCKVPLASTEDITVAASRGRRPKVVIFKYDPGSSYLIVPRITQIDRRTILTSVQHMSSIIYRAEEWDGLSIRYDIGSIDYPDDPRAKK